MECTKVLIFLANEMQRLAKKVLGCCYWVKINTLKRYFIFLLFVLIPLIARSEIVIAPGSNTFDLANHVSILKNVSVKLDIHQILEQPWSYRFINNEISGTALNIDKTSGAVWLKIELRVLPSTERIWILDIPYGKLKSIEWYVPKTAATKTNGDGYIAASELIPAQQNYRYHAQPIELLPGIVTLYARILADHPITLPLKLQTEKKFLSQEQYHLFIQGLYFGALATLILFSLLFAWSVKDITYAVFSAYLLTSGLSVFMGNGLSRLLLWTNTSISESKLELILLALAGACSLWLTSLFQHQSSLSVWFKESLRWLAGAYLVLAFGILVDDILLLDLKFLHSALPLLTLISSVVVIIALWIDRTGNQSEIYYLFGWVVAWLGALIASLRYIRWIESNTITLYAIQISMGLAATLFSIALFKRVRKHYQEKLLFQQETLDARRKLIETLQESERKLEFTVLERTAQLNTSLQTEKGLREQYVRFGAMISHEFRNPLSVIETQTSLLQREIKSGVNHIDKRIGTIRSASQRLALLFEKWLQSDRLQNATDKLNYSNLKFEGWFEDLINKCSIYHANHKINHRIKNTIGSLFFDEHLLQIAILNLIDNACKYSEPGTQVSIEAARSDGKLYISVTDRGIGIDPDLHEKIFDEYFRVDPNNKVHGVGLGLPFVRKIVSLHGGEVTLDQHAKCKGSRFIMIIPIKTTIESVSH